MGWFWADAAPTKATGPPSAHPRFSNEPPPGCPMHKSPPSPAQVMKPSSPSSACPYQPPTSTPDAPSTTATPTPSYISKLNPLNYMPSHISNQRESTAQTVSLPLDREASTIPRGDGTGTWEHPSPQQMYNAMLRKGYTDTPAEHVEAMVAVHNFLNEGAWEEIKGWEARFGKGLAQGWERCRRGEANAERQLALEAFRREQSARRRLQASSQQQQHRVTGAGEGAVAEIASSEPTLLRFMGRPNEPTPKARMLGFMAWAWPSQFPNNPPFDRHDWFVQRTAPGGETREVRYVIDYYSGPPEPTGEPVFYLDVRPAVDGPTAACERLMRWGGDVWYRASGASVREELERQKARS